MSAQAQAAPLTRRVSETTSPPLSLLLVYGVPAVWGPLGNKTQLALQEPPSLRTIDMEALRL